MRIRNFSRAKDIIKNCEFLITNPKDYKGNFKSIFNNDNPIHLEIGMGKGTFLLSMALENPHINYIGVEKFDSIVAKAIEKITPYELSNLKIIRIDALELEEIFDKEIECIYLNFSDPWPKKRHAKRRLTSPEFLNIYDKLFDLEANIYLKTDNKGLFAYSLESFSQNGYKLEKVSLDLANSDITNIETEYEKKFTAKGETINYLHASKKI